MERSKQLTYTLQEVRAIKKKAKDDGYKKGWNACKHYYVQMEQFDHKELQKIKNDYAALQAKIERYEKERHETRLAMRMLLKVFRGVARSPEQEKYYEQADYIFNKFHDVTDVLRNEALAGDGEKEKVFTFDQVQAMLIEFAIAYYNAPNKDIANDAAEYMYDNLNQKEGKQ